MRQNHSSLQIRGWEFLIYEKIADRRIWRHLKCEIFGRAMVIFKIYGKDIEYALSGWKAIFTISIHKYICVAINEYGPSLLPDALESRRKFWNPKCYHCLPTWYNS